MKRLVLIDGNALVHRAFHALPPNMAAPDGTLTNAVYGFVSILLKAVKDFQPEYMAAAFDLAGPTFRHEEFADYKAHREKAPDELYQQMDLVKSLLEKFGIPVFSEAGYEADDLIGTLATKARQLPDLETIILTGDLDTLQLVDAEKVKVFTARKGIADTVLYDEAAVQKRFGLKPEQVVDFKGLKGDPSDNIPGVPGVGDKTATALLQEYGSIEGLYEFLEAKPAEPVAKKKPKTKTKAKALISDKLAEKLLANKEQALFSKKLATIICDLKIDFSLKRVDWRKNFDEAAVAREFNRLGFNSMVARLKGVGLGLAVPSQQGQLFAEEPASPIASSSSQSPTAVRQAIKQAGKVYLLLQAEDLLVVTVAGTVTVVQPTKLGDWADILTDPAIAKSGYDLKRVYKVLAKQGVKLAGITFDVMLAAYLLKPDLADWSLASINQWAGLPSAERPAADIELVFDKQGPVPNGASDGSQRQSNFGTGTASGLPLLCQELAERIKSLKLNKILEEIELPLITVLAEMELQGIAIDTKTVAVLAVKAEKEVKSLEEKIYQLAGEEFNINSPQQLGTVLFDKLKISVKVRKTSGGAKSTAASELEKMAADHPIVELVLRYREVQKLKNTYIDPFPQLIDKADQRLHTTYNQTGAVTGRLSSQDPNLQNIPIRSELGQEFRRAFVAAPGYQLVSLDYSQIELRIMAQLSGDEKMRKAFLNSEDIHTRTAAEVFGVRPDQVSPNMRREAKALNFGILYGMGALGFARSAGVSREQARQFIDKYLNEFSGVASFMESLKHQARRQGFVSTFYGRRRELPEINSDMPQLIAQAERMAVNAPIQGTAADIMKLAMIQVFNYLRANFSWLEARLLLQVHDELLLEIKSDLVEKITPEIKKIMQAVWPAEIPVVVDSRVGPNWAEME